MPIFSINLTSLFKQAITYVVLASLQLGTLTQVTQAYAQNVPQMAQLGAPSSAPFSGYNPDGTLYMGGQRIGNPHQVLHDAQIPAFMTITANRYTYSADPTHGQGTLAQMELATTNGSTSSVLLNRLYLSPNNPYATTQPLGQVWPYPNYQTYQGVLLNSQQAGYLGTTAQDGKDYLFKTLTAASSQAFTILIKELPNTPQFRAAADPAGGGVGVRVSQNGDAAALAAYYKTVQPYDFTWRPNADLYTGSGNGSGQNGQLDPMYSGWANSPGGAFSGAASYAEGSGAPQSFNDFIKQQQAEALANDKRVRSQTTANSLDLSNTNVNSLFGEGYNLFDYGNKANPNLAAENEYLRKLQNGEFNAGSADYNEASRIAQERYRIAYATRLETGKPLQYSVADSQRKANELNLLDTNPNKLFGDGYDLFNYDPLTNPNGAAENALLSRLQSGQLTPGTPEYDEAKSIAQQRYRNAYSNSLAFNIAPKFTVAEAQRKANEIDLSQVNPNELFGQGFDLFQYNPALRPNGEAENVLLAKLQNGELTAGSAEYLEATQIAQQRLRDAYSISLVPPEPKKIPKWKMITGVVVGAILTFVTAGAAAPYVLSALTGISVAAAGTIITGGFLAGTLLGAAVTVGAGIVGGYVGAVISTGITTGSFSQALRAGEKVLISGTVKGFVTTILASSLGLGGLEGMEATLGNIAVNSLSGGITQTILNGGSFGDNLKTAALDSVTEEIAKGIGEKFASEIKNANLGDFGTELAHGALGCVTGTIRAQSGDGCAPGAAGAVGGHLIAPVIFGDTKAQYLNGTLTEQQYEQARADAAFYSGVIGGGIAAGLGSTDQVNANFGVGSAAGNNAALNNYLAGWQKADMDKALAECTSTTCKLGVNLRYLAISAKQDFELISGMGLGVVLTASEIANGITQLPAAMTAVLNNPAVLSQIPENYANEIRTHYEEYLRALEQASDGGATAAGVEYIKLVGLISALPATVRAAAELPALISSVANRAANATTVGVAWLATRAPSMFDRVLSPVEQIAFSAEATATGISRGEWLKNMAMGNAFNAERASSYPYSELYVNKPDGSGYFKLDSYNPTTGEIVSRKFTQLESVQESTAIAYINEIAAKYPAGASIANVPSTKPALLGQTLQGNYYLEVPVQTGPIPQRVLDAANRAQVKIRDVNGRIY